MDTSQLKIITEKLILKPISFNYVEDIFKEFTPEITTFMHPKPAENISETEEFIKNSMREKKAGTDLVMGD